MTAPAPNPLTQPSKLDPAWQIKTRELFKQTIESPTVVGRGQVPQTGRARGRSTESGRFCREDIRIIPYEGLPGDKTAALIVPLARGQADRKPILLMGHMDVVEAKREDWTTDPFVLSEEDGYFYGRGTAT